MGKASLNITDPNMRSDNQITGVAEIDSAISGAVGGDFTRDHIDETTSSIITVGTTPPAGPATYEAWRDTTASIPIDKFWSGSAWLPVNSYVQSDVPTTTVVNSRWFDTNLNMWRVYRELHGVTGWHPVTRGYKLMENVSGAEVLAGRVVIYSTSGTDSDFSVTNIIKYTGVAGVLIEDTDNGSPGVVQLLGCADPVDVYVVGSTHGSVAAGDALVIYGDETGDTTPDGGSARQVGPYPLNPVNTITSHHHSGVPLGAFAVALEVATTDTKIKCRLLPQVGEGCHVLMDRTAQIGSTISQTGSGSSSWTEVDLSSYLKDAGHSPIFSADMEFRVTMTAGASQSGQIEISPNQTDILHELFTQTSGSATAGYTTTRTILTVEDSTTATPAGMGDKFSIRATMDTTETIGANVRCLGYTY